MAGEFQSATTSADPTGLLPSIAPATPATAATAPASDDTQTSSALALPALNPSDSPYQPLNLPTVQTPTVHPLPAQQPVRDLGAVTKAGGIAYLANQVLRGAVKGYDAARLQHAAQANGRIDALGKLQNQLGQEYVQAYNDVGSSKPGMTTEQILADPRVKKLHDQLLAVHQSLLGTIHSYLPQLQQGTKGGKSRSSKTQKRSLLERMFSPEPDEALEAYAQVAGKMGPEAFYQVANPQQLAALYDKRQAESESLSAAGETVEAKAAKARNKARLQELYAEGRPSDPAAAKKWDTEVDNLRMALTPLSAKPTADQMRRQDYEALLMSGQIPKDARGVPMAYEEWVGYESAHGHAAGTPAHVPTVGSFGDFMLGAYGPHPTPKDYVEGRKLWASSGAGTTVGTHTVLVTQGNKQVPYTFTTTSTKSYGGGVPAAPNVRVDQGAGASAAAPAATTSAASAAPSETVPWAPQPHGALNPYHNPEDQPSQASFAFNHQWAKPGPYVTKLSPEDEAKFQQWVQQNHVPWQDTPDADYDMRGYWKALTNPSDPHHDLTQRAKNGHYSDYWKTPYSGVFSRESMYATPKAPRWVGQKLYTTDGRLVTDETPRRPEEHAQAARPTAARTSYAPGAPRLAGPAVGYKFSPGTIILLQSAKKARNIFQSARADYNDAQQNARDIAKDPTNGIAKMNLVATFLRTLGEHSASVSGSQVRLTQAEWNQVQQSAPVIARFLSKFASTQNGETVLSGVTLTPDQVIDLVRAVGEKAVSLRQSAEAMQRDAQAAAAKDREGVVGTGGRAPAAASTAVPQTHSDLNKEILQLVHSK